MIRAATAADAATVARLINAAYRVEEFFIHGERTDEAEIRELQADGDFLLLEEDSAPTGCVYVTINPPRGYLGMLAVEPGRQGGGRARRLVNEVERRCRDGGCAWVDLNVVNLRVELPAFYERLGYAQIGTSPWPANNLAKLKQRCHFVLFRKPLR